MIPIYDSTGKSVAMLAADVSIDEIYETRLHYVIVVSIAALILMVISLFLMNAWLKRRVVDPLQRLKDTAGSFVESTRHAASPDDLVIADPDIHTQDEMEALSNSITEMFADMKHYMTDLVNITMEKERIGAELNVATQIQADMLPNIFPAFPERDDINIYASMTPAKEVGGDFYDFFFVDHDHLAIVMADVSGKGVPAALFMVIAKTLIKSVFQNGGEAGEALADVNDRLCEGNEAGLFVTVWMAVIDLKTGEGVSLNAGHEHPALCKAGGDYELVVYRHSVAVAAMEGMVFQERRFKLDMGDKLFVYTDGVPEATNAENELFGTDRMIEALNKNKDKSLKEQVDGMKESIDEFVKDAPQFDDITMLCFEYKGVIDD